MTLHDAGLWFKAGAALFGVFVLLRVLFPFYMERQLQREADERRAREVQHYLDESVRKYY